MAEIPFYLLDVDLTTGTRHKVDVTRDVKIYCAGRGLANNLIWDLVRISYPREPISSVPSRSCTSAWDP
jgi:aldehyde:ferredoxin oxidoreductase